ncbi:MAG: anion transporter [Nannocystis sp.]|uniref:SLC13 family permease n=1 Tax=Nannocystis sp. TaxID=1962667 RepID=UPI0024259B3A|nr:SLC13 family permease [Nannocystis sp.]MBK9753630.1 anion transporter [Nannocystis sp.]
MHAAVVTVFLATYLLVATRRLTWLPVGRVAGALLGAAVMVAIGGLTPAQSFAAIDHDTILLLFGMMLLIVYLERGGLFARVVAGALTLARTPGQLLVLVSLLSGILSAFLVNDAVCLLLTPIVVALGVRAGLPLAPYLLAICTSANIGSAATLVGNPQNMIIGNLSGLGFGEFMALAGPPALVGLAINTGLLWLYYRRRLPAGSLPAAPDRVLAIDPLVLPVLALVTIGFLAGLHLGYTALAGALVFVVRDRRAPEAALAKVDWGLLVFFCGLFIVVQALANTGLPARVWAGAAPSQLGSPGELAAFTGLLALGSNVVSNVPMVLLAGPEIAAYADPRMAWVLLALVTTVAGNFTLLGSVANLIVAEQAAPQHELGFFEYLRFGVVSTLLVLPAVVAVLWCELRWLSG